MKLLLCLLTCLLCFTAAGFAARRTSGYVKKNGTYVAPSYRTKADGNKYNNYSTKGNYNPYTGKKGKVKPYKYKKSRKKY
jgi:hypothetical protein